MKYKLIKKYPSSLELGTVVTLYSNWNMYGINNECIFEKEYIESHPEFWERVEEEELCVPFGTKIKVSIDSSTFTIKKGTKKNVIIEGEFVSLTCPISYVNSHIEEGSWIVQKDYEILSFINKNKESTIINKDNYIFGYGCFGKEKKLLESDEWEIYSIRRLSDGKVFSIGDFVNYSDDTFKYDKRGYEIDYFSYKEGRVYIKKHYSNKHKDRILIDTWVKYEEPLFTSKDGKEIFEGDKFYCVDDTDYSMSQRIGGDGLAYHLEDVVDRCYSTENSAEEYILMNKPCLSINDVIKSSNNTDLIQHVAIGKLMEKVQCRE